MIIERGQETMTVCPIARCSATATSGFCQGEACPIWRWVPLLTTEPGFKSAVVGLMTEDKLSHAKAVKEVTENRAKYGLPTEPWRGFCGLGGRPTDVGWVER